MGILSPLPSWSGTPCRRSARVKQSGMRSAITWLLFLLSAGCSAPEPAPQVRRVYMKWSGWESVEVEVNRQGEGRYRLSHGTPGHPRGRAGSFSISQQQFKGLLDRLRPFQRQAVPLTSQSVREILEGSCPAGVPNVTDAGGFWAHWTGPHLNSHYSADFGCDHERQRARNEQLNAILQSLPVPSPE
jgi:hypothetical protein